MPTLEVNEPKKEMKPAMKWVIIALAGLIVGAILYGVYEWRLDADKAAYFAALKTQNRAPLTGNYTGAVEGWEKYRHRMWPRQYDFMALLNEASLYQTMHKDKEALALYRLAEPYSTAKDTAAYQGIASVSEEMGDYATAIKYFQKEEDIYAKMASTTSERQWMHAHIMMLQQKETKNAAK